MQLYLKAKKNNFILVSIVIMFFTACEKESVIIPINASFMTNAAEDTIMELAPLRFTNTSPDNCTYLWDFGNGTASTVRNPIAFYHMHGTYTISLEITNKQGVSSLYSRKIIILCRFYNQNHNGEIL